MDDPSPAQHTLPQPPETTFDSRENLVNYVRGWAKAQGYPVSIHKSDKVKVTFICIKGGPVRKRVDDTIRQRKRSSRKIGCMFKATARLSNKDEKWHLTITNASHNHSAEQSDAPSAPQHREPDPVELTDTGVPNDTLMGGTGDLGLLDGEGLTSPSTLEVVMRYPSSDLAGRVMNLEATKRVEDGTIRELRQQNRLLAEQNSILKAQLDTLKQQTEVISRQPDLSSLLNAYAPNGVRVLLEYYLVSKWLYDGAQSVIDFVAGERLLQVALDLNLGAELEKVHNLFFSSFPYGSEKPHETTLHHIIVAIRLSDDGDVLHTVFHRCFRESPAYFANQDHFVRSLPHPEFTPLRSLNKHIQQPQPQHYNGFARHPQHTLASHRMGHPHGVRMGN